MAVVGALAKFARDGEILGEGIYAFLCTFGGRGKLVERSGTTKDKDCPTPERERES